ncbi:RNA polymerase sigma factor [Gaoshiqia sediminis]|uniref:RNA polymerase sigma-70 factor n=1 Tax=Gaoshiqia sediminis TaxID=2986998 RepID=A0AA42C5J4_9BACT|nr:RNA polymerase sigma-70 factor [Gaoshiqia sediminis]MCW0481624.1 RNA polymerase sigma-70 factor [Gaoshiqia sediminis]
MQQAKPNIGKNILLQLKEGNPKAFNSIFRHYNQRLYFFALGYLKSEKEAEEIVQETFLKLWERREHLDLTLSFHAYLFKIAFNFIQKRLQRQVKDDELKHELADELVNFDQHTSNLVNYHHLLQHINRLIGQLPPRQAQILKLRKLDGYSTSEISDMLRLASKTVEAHLTAALKFLKEKLNAEKFDDLLLFVLTLQKKF